MTKSKTTTITISGVTAVEALRNASEELTTVKYKAILQITSYPVDDYWVVQVTYK